MRLSPQKIKQLAKLKGLSLNNLLKYAGVSKTAYYSLSRAQTILPKSIISISDQLNVQPIELLESLRPEEISHYAMMKKLNKILKDNPTANPDNIRHTLILLNKKPIERLERALLRGQAKKS